VSDITYDVISADSHVIEPPDVWVDRVPAEYRDRAPRLVHEDDTDRLLCDQTVLPGIGMLAGCYRADNETRWQGRWDGDVPVGAYDPDVRLADLAVDGIDAEVLFPTLGLRLYPIEDVDFQWALFRAYNTWLAETFCVPHKGRFLGIAMLNHEDVDLAVAELVRAKEIGLSGVMVPVEPNDEDPYWDRRFDPLWAAAVDHEMPVNLHLTTTRKRKMSGNAPRIASPGERLATGENVQPVLLDMIHFGVFDRFPGLKIVAAENDAGWAAYLIESQDYTWHRYAALRPDKSSEHEPGYYFHQNIRTTFMRDRAAILAREIIGVHTMMWGNDFPHFTSTWPHSKEALDTMFHDQPQDVRDAIVRDNVRALYKF
jgi:predicted TIM-barrel fold metal-dependent hydrolase